MVITSLFNIYQEILTSMVKKKLNRGIDKYEKNWKTKKTHFIKIKKIFKP